MLHTRILCQSIILLALAFISCHARIHHLTLTNDIRRYFSVSTFGFFTGGKMLVDVEKMSFYPEASIGKFGFSLTRTVSNSVTPYLDPSRQETCLQLDDPIVTGTDAVKFVTFIVNPEKNEVITNCSTYFNIKISSPESRSTPGNSSQRNRRNIGVVTSDTFLMQRKKRQQPVEELPSDPNIPPDAKSDVQQTPLPIKKDNQKEQSTLAPISEKSNSDGSSNGLPEDPDDMKREKLNNLKSSSSNLCSSVVIPLKVKKDPVTGLKMYHFKFQAEIWGVNQSGLYSLYFHNCANYDGSRMQPTSLNLSISINEHNLESYLSAGEIPLPQLYFIMSVTFFCLGCGWIYVLRRKTQETFKIHYLMGLLIFVKSLSLLFHGINYYFIARDGFHIEAWAVMYYITHLLKGALLFITIVLIGTGWAFIKHILSDKDKKIFMIVIPLQVLANVAEIIMEESEEGETQHNTWREVFILVDLLCCGAILFPVVWSIRHLQDASQTDGKAAINLEKLKVFRHFYVMIVCYIYFTRIIVFLLKITVPFQYEWLDEFFREIATLVFFLVTGYKFRPTYSNPYFRLSQAEEEALDMDEVVTQSGITEQVYKTRRSSVKESTSNTTSKRESSHEYD